MLSFDVASGLLLLLAAGSVILASLVPTLHPLLDYGKIQPSRLNALTSLQVPKSWFGHFYVELVALLLIRVVYLNSVQLRDVLLLVQGVRRLYEQLCVLPKSRARMHVTHYCAGILFYAVQALHVEKGQESTLAVLMLFVLGSVWQAMCHCELARTKKYDLPAFCGLTSPALRTACPHYGAELLIYISLVVLEPTFVPVSSLTWVAVSLGVSGERSRKFYGDVRWTMCPYVF